MGPHEPSSGLEDRLLDYARSKLELGEIVRPVLERAERQGDDTTASACRKFLERLVEDSFNLAVIGQFSRGKSTLMNAMLGLDRLPTGVRPLTSVVTTVSYGDPESLRIRQEGSDLPLDLALDRLPDYVTQDGNPDNRKRVTLACVRLPAELLRLGFFFIDTPGVGSAIAANTRATREFLPEADAAIFVTSFESPLTVPEIELLREALRRVRQVFWVVNKADLMPEPQREEVLAYLQAEAKEALGLSHVPLFPLSSRDALMAKLANDSAKLAASGLCALEGAVTRFFQEEKRRQFLTRSGDRVGELLSRIELDLLAQTPASQDSIGRLARLRQRLSLWRKNALGENPDRLERPPHVPRLDNGRRSQTPCLVCERAKSALFDFMCKRQYDLCEDEAIRRQHADMGGFCAAHTWYYESLASPQGVSVAYPSVLGAASEKLASLAESHAASDQLSEAIRRLIPDESKCCACQVVAEQERQEMEAFLNRTAAEHEEGLSALCLVHLRGVLGMDPQPAAARLLIRTTAAALAEIVDDMRGFALKRSALRRQLWSKAEKESYFRGLSRLAGDRSLSTGRRATH